MGGACLRCHAHGPRRRRDELDGAWSVPLHALTAPDVLQKLRDELDDVFGKGVPCDDFDELNKKCPYLNAVINEDDAHVSTIASGLQKETPASGLQVQVQGKQIVIPPHTVVHTPTMTMHRDPRYFSPEPNAYRPERWLDHHKNEERFEIKAFNPFPLGPRDASERRWRTWRSGSR
ncbi:hypothetical protein L7F22_040103 [Adiantum nelumboides]|nr:hypothetical protein [Adiantum nelumboides]